MGTRLGQHFLTSPRIAERIAKSADIQPNDTVLEIGPGTGILTAELLKRAKRVIAVEKDTELIEKLREKFDKNKNLVLIEADIRDVLKKPRKFNTNVPSIKVVANIPYYLSGQLFRLLVSDRARPPSLIVLMVQKEVAERIANRTRPSLIQSKTNLLGLSIQPFMTARIAFRVSRGNFRPPPGVDSAVLVLERRSRPLLISGSPTSRYYFALIKTAFGQKRKIALSVLKKGAFKGSPYLIPNPPTGGPWGSFLGKCKISKTARAENISLEQWLCLARQNLHK
ncbi:MAG: ribosomal RNA small subunit methyltransferase A [Candidatus Niyogibacteria bacterium]|nr:ribosomal RNA small subunit methyltransferase A [Candidatus Niyogibacteria bacterium]